MNFHIIIDHPWKESFNHAVMRQFVDGILAKGHSADILDLNEDAFDPVLSADALKLYNQGGYTDPKVGEYQQRLQSAEHLALFFPIWWMVMPARLKGWLDKVLLPGFAFTLGQFPEPMLTHIKTAAIFTTTAVPDDFHREEFNDALEWVLCKGTLKFTGIQEVRWFNFGEAGFASQEKHQDWLKFVKDYAMRF